MGNRNNPDRRTILKTSASMLAAGSVGSVAATRAAPDDGTSAAAVYGSERLDREPHADVVSCSEDSALAETNYGKTVLSQCADLVEVEEDGAWGDDWYYLEVGMTSMYASYYESMDFPYYDDSPELSKGEFCDGEYQPDELPGDVNIDRGGLSADHSITLELENSGGSLMIPDGSAGIGASPAGAVGGEPTNEDEAAIAALLGAAGVMNPYFGAALAVQEVADAYGITDDDPSIGDNKHTFSWYFDYANDEPTGASVQFAIRVPPGESPTLRVNVQQEAINIVDELEKTYGMNEYGIWTDNT